MAKFDHGDWGTRRRKLYEAIVDLIPKEDIVNKRILEVGCGVGHLGMMFYELTPHIIGFDVREEHIEDAKKLHPELEFFVWDMDIGWPDITGVDIIFHIGTLYHLSDPRKNLLELCALLKPNQYVILETEFVNSADPDKTVGVKQKGYNVSYERIGNRPSHAMIEGILESCNMRFHRVMTNKYNSAYYQYDAPYSDDNSLDERAIRGIWYFYKE